MPQYIIVKSLDTNEKGKNFGYHAKITSTFQRKENFNSSALFQKKPQQHRYDTDEKQMWTKDFITSKIAF